jgi:hypothetical protein
MGKRNDVIAFVTFYVLGVSDRPERWGVAVGQWAFKRDLYLCPPPTLRMKLSLMRC